MATLSTSVEVLPIESDERFQSLAGDALELLARAHEIEIVDHASDMEAKEFVVQVTRARRRWGELRTWFVGPLNNQVNAINSLFKAQAAPVEQAEQIVRKKVATYFAVKQAEARKEQQRLQKLAEARNARQAAKAEANGTEPPPAIFPLPIVATPEKTTHTASGSTTIRRVWDFEIVDEMAVPREYLAVDERKIGAVVKAGIRNIPGVYIFEKEELAVR
jgi:hypothetical protein